MEKKDRTTKYRGKQFSTTFIEDFLGSEFNTEIIQKHKDDLLLGIRNGYLNIYYNCDSIAKIQKDRNNKIYARISSYYLKGQGEGYEILGGSDFCEHFQTIIKNSEKRITPEKKAQHTLVVNNNNNEQSKWYCIDVEYKKAYVKTDDREDNFSGRFDIVAISKAAPHKVAVIELKYGSAAIGGKSGIRKHIKDFCAFAGEDKCGTSYFDEFKDEIVSMLKAQKDFNLNVPQSLEELSVESIDNNLEFYVITLGNIPDVNGNTPKMTMSGYLFKEEKDGKDGIWNCRKISSLINKEGDFYELTKHRNNFKTTFLFSPQENGHITIDDILDEKYYDVEIIESKKK